MTPERDLRPWGGHGVGGYDLKGTAFQESLPDPESTVPPEVFTVGSKTFSWTPFPPALRGSGSSCRLLRCPEGSPGSPAPSLKGCPALDSRQTPSTQECVQSQLVLLNCPLCQKAFDPK